MAALPVVDAVADAAALDKLLAAEDAAEAAEPVAEAALDRTSLKLELIEAAAPEDVVLVVPLVVCVEVPLVRPLVAAVIAAAENVMFGSKVVVLKEQSLLRSSGSGHDSQYRHPLPVQ